MSGYLYVPAVGYVSLPIYFAIGWASLGPGDIHGL